MPRGSVSAAEFVDRSAKTPYLAAPGRRRRRRPARRSRHHHRSPDRPSSIVTSNPRPTISPKRSRRSVPLKRNCRSAAQAARPDRAGQSQPRARGISDKKVNAGPKIADLSNAAAQVAVAGRAGQSRQPRTPGIGETMGAAGECQCRGICRSIGEDPLPRRARPSPAPPPRQAKSASSSVARSAELHRHLKSPTNNFSKKKSPQRSTKKKLPQRRPGGPTRSSGSVSASRAGNK